jgi:O-acetyl-ADP-ribose deacetylase (regulator of RNase III)
MTVNVISGDISRVHSDAIITAINSGGMWFGGIDGVLKRAAGNHFHNQASAAMPLEDGMTVVAPGGNVTNLPFQNVIFVVDDLQQPLGNIVFLGLQAAQAAGFKSVTIPTIRMGVMSGAVEKTKQEAVDRMADGIERFVLQGGQLDITFVVYSDMEVQALLSAAASQLNTTLSELQP